MVAPSLSHPTAVIFWLPLSVALSNLTMSGLSLTSFSSVRSQLSRVRVRRGKRFRFRDSRSMEKTCTGEANTMCCA